MTIIIINPAQKVYWDLSKNMKNTNDKTNINKIEIQ